MTLWCNYACKSTVLGVDDSMFFCDARESLSPSPWITHSIETWRQLIERVYKYVSDVPVNTFRITRKKLSGSDCCRSLRDESFELKVWKRILKIIFVKLNQRCWVIGSGCGGESRDLNNFSRTGNKNWSVNFHCTKHQFRRVWKWCRLVLTGVWLNQSSSDENSPD